MAALLLAGPAMASCGSVDDNSSGSCTLDGSSNGYVAVKSINSGATGTYTLTNNTNFEADSGQNVIAQVVINGTDGGGTVSEQGGRDAAEPGHDGGRIAIINDGELRGRGTPDQSRNAQSNVISGYMGLFDDPGLFFGLLGAGAGGTGGHASSSGDGGLGGQGGLVTITNNRYIDIDMTLPSGGVAIFGSSISGTGGQENGGAGDGGQDDMGGDGGLARQVTIINNDDIDFVATGAGTLNAIRIENFSGNGGSENGDGGQPGVSVVTSAGDIDLDGTWTAAGPENGIAGISVFNRSGNGAASEDNSDPGGAGGQQSRFEITVTRRISVDATGAVEATVHAGQSGAVIGYTQGGTGGQSPSPNITDGVAGVGGGATNSESFITIDGAEIEVTGDNTIGVGAFSRGGDGGIGRGQASGADGGDGSELLVTTKNDVRTTTDGYEGHAIVAISEGGTGGYQDPDGDGIVEFTDPDAGDGGNGGPVTVITGAGDYGYITTLGERSFGIHAQSFGGAGGGGGASFVLAGQSSADAGGGGAGASVTVSSSDEITTSGAHSIGILAHSVGGGGGDVDPSLGLISVAGDAQQGGDGGTVTIDVYQSVATAGVAAVGVVGQSVGGGGGNGGSTIGVYTVGGQGGAGGTGGAVDITLHGDASISTSGDHAFGVLGHSISDGGGTGGSVLSVGTVLPTVGIGGTGGSGGQAGPVAISTDENDLGAEIRTTGANGHAIVAQSVGGGGGTGGDAVATGFLDLGSFAIAGGGGGAGNGSTVDVTLDRADITTIGSHGTGILAQSIGGGGGAGGSASSFDLNLGFSLAASVGGGGGGGGAGAATTVSLSDVTITTGDAAYVDVTNGHGVLAQSVGGSGGYGGSSATRSTAITIPSEVTEGVPLPTIELGASVGGGGGAGGNSGPVTVSLSDTEIHTIGDGSFGIFGQAVGGAGGAGGSATTMGVIRTIPGSESPLKANVNVSVGGGGAAGGDGGTVTGTLADGSGIVTDGLFSNAVHLQSIGGGGGDAGFGSAEAYTPDFLASGVKRIKGSGEDEGEGGGEGGGEGEEGEDSKKIPALSFKANIGVGGTGGNGGAGGTVRFSHGEDSEITTNGSGSNGVLLQTVGGSGGTSQGVSVGASFGGLTPGGLAGEFIPTSATVKVGRAGPLGGSGGAIDEAVFDGTITTFGADASGVVIQSIGGGGGIGGSVGGGDADETGLVREVDELKVDLSQLFDISLAFGGSGGAAGDGAPIASAGGSNGLRLSGSVTTFGDHAKGLLVQSIGGGGGSGGAGTVDTSISLIRAFAAVGGTGGAAGDGGRVELQLDGGTVATGGFASHGIVLQSIGGGGGAGGDASRSACSPINLGGGYAAKLLDDYDGPLSSDDAEPTQRCLDFVNSNDVEGDGGASGDGGAVSIVAAPSGAREVTVMTAGDHAHAFVAQSVGSGGGFYASGTSLELDYPDENTAPQGQQSVIVLDEDGNPVTVDYYGYRMFVGLGGNGMGGASIPGAGGAVDLDAVFALATAGDASAGLLAQSIGGGGGFFGGSGISGLQLGGQGSGVNASGDEVTVTLEQNSSIATTGHGAHGLVAQSIGGGGGFATGTLAPDAVSEDAPIAITVGGTGDANGAGGRVTATIGVFSDGDPVSVDTAGDLSRGVIAQSIGGGGGAYAGITDELGAPYVDVPIRAGDESSGPGGAVSVHLLGAVSTAGLGADGIVAQSIGAGGGIADIADRSGDDAADVDIGVGGTGGGNGNAGPVDINLDGDKPNPVATLGDFAYGILAQSIGGGGGSVFDATSSAAGKLVVGGAFDSPGSSLGSSTNDSCDATRGNGDTGCAVRVSDYIASLTTLGDDAHGLVAQSVAGGGGVGRVVGNQSGTGIDITLGGSQAMESDAGDVLIELQAGALSTGGNRAHGIVAQSIAGGGGIASAGSTFYTRGVAIGDASGSGQAGDVTVNWRGNLLQTGGDHAHGLVAQSIGGGGGIGGDASSQGLSLDNAGYSSGGSGDGGAVTVTFGGTLDVSGVGAMGVVAQSIGGGGGLWGWGGGSFAGTAQGGGLQTSAGPVSITQEAASTITASGEYGIGIFAQAQATDTADAPISITVNGSVIGGLGDGASAILVSGGNGSNTLTVSSTGSLDAASGVAVSFDATGGTADALLTVDSSGPIMGDFVGTGTITELAASDFMAAAIARPIHIENRETGTLSGRIYHADIRNAGTFHLAGQDMKDDVLIAGDFSQLETGALVAEIDFATAVGDRLRIEGDARFGGTLRVVPETAVKGAEFTLISVGGEIEGAFAEISPGVFEYAQYAEAGTLTLAPISADFNRPEFGLDSGQAEVARYLGAVFETSDAGLADVIGLAARIADETPGDFGDALSRLSPGATVADGAAAFALSDRRLDGLIGCEGFATTADGACFKVTASGALIDEDSRDGAIGYDGSVFTAALGAEIALADGLSAGFALGFERSDYDGNGGLGTSEGNTGTVGASVTQRWGDFSLSLAGSASVGTFETERLVAFGERLGTAEGGHTGFSAAGRVRAAYDIGFGATTLTPMLDLDVIHSATDSYRETGAGGLDLVVSGGSETGVRVEPALAIRHDVSFENGLGVSAFGRLGVSVSSADSFAVDARFAGASAAAGTFESAVPVSRVLGRVSLGAAIRATDSIDIGARYDGAFGSNSSGHAVTLAVEWRF
ncbi:autotransporter [Paralimibaculum aggregatum]|uniref:Autotransporter n=1 Tax=Paralimibaculum aggregatum TaxID=3036245 RepID=A0ABQ6LSX2_9RHOB|nr:autotransporter [Limibaculum sp. NKW23]